MKMIRSIMLLLLAATLITSCNKVSYRKTKSGLAYKIFPGNGKDSLIKNGKVVKFQVTSKLNDSLLYSSYDKIPAYQRYMETDKPVYNLLAVLPMMRKGDSAVTVQMVDTLLNGGAQLPPFAKKGDRIITTVRILEVFSNDSLASLDYNAAMEKDRPRQLKEQEEQMAKMEKDRKEQELKDDLEMEKSGEIDKELKAMDAYLASKKIIAQKTGRGTYVSIQQEGTGPVAAAGKYVNVKYIGKFLTTDSVFESNTYAFQLGKGNAIRGWHEGLQLFKKGSKGTLYIPGFLAYGKNPPQGSPFKLFEPLKFDVELLEISDTPIAQQQQPVH
jgi:FKBP-type peptidyl-prolyl cis-trans isomerase FkpA